MEKARKRYGKNRLINFDGNENEIEKAIDMNGAKSIKLMRFSIYHQQ